MTDRRQELLDQMYRELKTDGPVEKQIILLKLQDKLEGLPDFGTKPAMRANDPQRKWLAEVGALLGRLGITQSTNFKATMSTAAAYWVPAMEQIQGQVLDAIEEIKLELELDGRSEIGTAYGPGEAYRFFSDLKSVIAGATEKIFLIDPYLDGAAFDAYFNSLTSNIEVHILAEEYIRDIEPFVRKHREEFSTIIELRRSQEIHDRIIVIDDDSVWITGGSVKDAGNKPTYLIPLQPKIAKMKLRIYQTIWNNSPIVQAGT